MKFAMSYSCGKDSTLALHKMLEQGHEPVCLVVMVNEAHGRSYFHGAGRDMLERYGKALSLPVVACPASGEGYLQAFEKGLAEAKAMGRKRPALAILIWKGTGSGKKNAARQQGLSPVSRCGKRGGRKLPVS